MREVREVHRARQKVLRTLIALLMAMAALAPVQSLAYADFNYTVGVNGRVLSAGRAGDSSDWIEIARNDGFSLIVRKDVLPGGFAAYATSGVNNSYSVSNARNLVNNWFCNTLSSSARLRGFTACNNAISDLGAFGSTGYGVSKPTGGLARTGNDVAFLLSFAEAANFCSMQYATSSSSWTSSPSVAQANFNKLTQLPTSPPQQDFWWLRSAGWNGNNASSVGTHSSAMQSCVFASSAITSAGYCYIRPALWVNSAIFEPDTVVSCIYVTHRDAQTGAVLQSNTYTLNISQPTSYGPYNALNFTGYQAGVLASYSDAPSGIINPGATKNITWLYTVASQASVINVNHVDAQTGAVMLSNSYPLNISQPTSYGPYNAQVFAGYQAGVLASYSDPASGTISPGQSKNITWLYTRSYQVATVNVVHRDAQSGAVLQSNSYQFNINQATTYGPYQAGSFTGYSAGQLAATSDPASGTINPGETKNVTWLYNRLNQEATINVRHLDAQTGAVLQSNSYTLSFNAPNSYGPYPALNFTGYQAGVLASYSDPASGTVGPGETKNITWLYTRLVQTSIIDVKHIDAQTGTVLLNETFRFDISQPTVYGHYSSKTFAGYLAGVLATYGDPASGIINPGETKNVIYLYTRASVNATVNVLHVNLSSGSVLQTDNYSFNISQPTSYGPYGARSIPGFGAGVLAPFGDAAAGSINPGETKNVIYLYTPVLVLSTVNIVHKDAQTGAVLMNESFTFNISQPVNYGPYEPRRIAGYNDGVRAQNSDPVSGIINPGETKTITFQYTRGTATIYILCIDLASNNTIKIEVQTVTAGNYGPITPPTIAGYTYRQLATFGDPVQGVVDANQTRVIVFQYARSNT